MIRVALFLYITLCTLFTFSAHGQLSDSTLEQALQKAESSRLWETKEWIRLIHYKDSLWGSTSEADGSPFFLAADGKTSPRNELIATLKSFYSGEVRKFPGTRNPDQSARCQFPARLSYLRKMVGVPALKVAECAEFEKFREKLRARSATLVFSSYFLNNPSSAFGHSLLRLNREDSAKPGERFQLLDYGVNYAATPTTSNPVLYAIFGLIGQFKGEFTSLPYFYKVREYNDFDSRDLWEYDLNLTQEEIDMLVAHIWELGFTHFDYYYFTENCSYHMLTLLDAAAPRLNLVSRIPFWVIPVDTIKAVWDEPGFVKDVHFRPSVRTQFMNRLEKVKSFSSANKLIDVLEKSKKGDSEFLPSEYSAEDQAVVIDAAIDFLDYKFGAKLIHNDPETKQWKQRLLLARSRLPKLDFAAIPAADEDRPHISHESARFALSFLANENGKGIIEANQRFALHDFLDPQMGYPSLAELDFFSFKVRYEEELKKLRLQDWTLFSVASFGEGRDFNTPLAWKVKLGFERVVDEKHCTDCVAGVLTTQGGFSRVFGYKTQWIPYIMASIHTQTSGAFRGPNWLVSAGPKVGHRLMLKRNLIFQQEGYWEKFLFVPEQTRWKFENEVRYAPNLVWAVGLKHKWDQRDQEYGLSGFYYY